MFSKKVWESFKNAGQNQENDKTRHSSCFIFVGDLLRGGKHIMVKGISHSKKKERR